jgi:hypothetical protein
MLHGVPLERWFMATMLHYGAYAAVLRKQFIVRVPGQAVLHAVPLP